MRQRSRPSRTASGSALSLPNHLTYGRLAAVPVVAGLILWGGDAARWMALVLFIAAAVTDFFDGYLARRWQQQSALGPHARSDRRQGAGRRRAPRARRRPHDLTARICGPAIIILSREVLVSGLREFLAELRVSVPVTKVAKWKTTVQLVAVGFLIAGPAGDKIMPHVTDFGLLCLWIAAALTLYTGYDYFRAGIGHVMDDK